MNKGKNYFWGFIFVAMAALVIIDALNIWEGVGFWSIVISVISIAVLAKGIFEINFAEILFPIAALAIVWDSQLGIEQLTPFPVLVAAAFGAIGLDMMFGGVRKNKGIHIEYHNDHQNTGTIEEDFGDDVVCSTSFTGITKYVNSQNLRSVKIHNTFGGATIYLDKAQAASDDVYVEIDAKFAGTEIFIPSDWVVDNKVNCSFGSVDTHGRNNNSQVVGTRLILVGNVSFGGVEIKYV